MIVARLESIAGLQRSVCPRRHQSSEPIIRLQERAIRRPFPIRRDDITGVERVDDGLTGWIGWMAVVWEVVEAAV